MRKGVSPLIGFVLSIALVTAAVTIVLTVIKPTFDRMSDSGIIDEGVQNLELINSAVKQVASESQGSKRTISLSVSEGEYGVDAAKDFVYFNYSTKTDFSLQGTIKNERLDKSPVFIEYFNNYVENSNASPPWTIKNGTWQVKSGEYSGQNGLAYYNFGNVAFFEIEGRMTNKSGTKGEIFALPVTPNDLVGYWTFDEGSGTTAWDYSGFNNTGTLTNMNTVGNSTSGWTIGKFDYGLKFDGVNDYVTVANSTSLNPNYVTISAWIYSRNPTNPGIQTIVARQGAQPYDFLISSGYFYMEMRTSSTAYNSWTTTYIVPANQWEYVTAVFDGIYEKLYVNGIFHSQNLVSPAGTLVITNNVPLLIGGGWSSYYFNGTIDEVRIYNRSLTADEVKSDYELGVKKLSSTGRTDEISQKTNVYLVLSNPNGNTYFDEVKIKTNKRVMMLSVPYVNVDLNGTARFPKGNYQLAITHMGVNTTLNKPIVQLSLA